MKGVGIFIGVFLGSFILGLTIGLLTSYILKKRYRLRSENFQISICLFMPYFC